MTITMEKDFSELDDLLTYADDDSIPMQVGVGVNPRDDEQAFMHSLGITEGDQSTAPLITVGERAAEKAARDKEFDRQIAEARIEVEQMRLKAKQSKSPTKSSAECNDNVVAIDAATLDDELEDLLKELSESNDAGAVETLATVTSAPRQIEEKKEPAPALPSKYQPITATVEDKRIEAHSPLTAHSAAASPNREAEAEVSKEGYRFPWVDESNASRFALMTDSELTSALGALINRRGSDRQPTSYLDIRIRVDCCTINVVMNQRGLLPPAFRPNRPLPKPVRGFKPSDEETIMLVDRQLIDIHWLHCRGRRHSLGGREFAELLNGDDFNRDLAERFALKGWTADIKSVKVLKLVEYDQWQMSVLRPKTIRDIWRNSRKSMENTIDLRLREQAVKEPDLTPHIEDFKYLWLADKIVGHLGQKIVGQVHSWLNGKLPLAPSTLSPKLRRMRRRTDPPRSRPKTTP